LDTHGAGATVGGREVLHRHQKALTLRKQKSPGLGEKKRPGGLMTPFLFWECIFQETTFLK
jgi:hypothetical protein